MAQTQAQIKPNQSGTIFKLRYWEPDGTALSCNLKNEEEARGWGLGSPPGLTNGPPRQRNNQTTKKETKNIFETKTRLLPVHILWTGHDCELVRGCDAEKRRGPIFTAQVVIATCEKAFSLTASLGPRP